MVNFKHRAYEKKHPIFSILRSSFDALELQIHQRMFKDLVLGRNSLLHHMSADDLIWQLRYLYDKRSYDFTFTLVRISLLHYGSKYLSFKSYKIIVNKK